MSTKKVLIIEADNNFSNELSKTLKAAGYASEKVADGKTGLDVVKSYHPDLLVLCVELQQMSGYLVCNKIRKDADTKDIPIIIMSSEATEETFQQHRKLKTHADDYLIKPFPMKDLVGKVKSLIGVSDGDEEVELGVGDDAIIAEELQLDGAQVREIEDATGVQQDSAKAKTDDGVFKEEDLKYLDSAFDDIIQEGSSSRDKGVRISVQTGSDKVASSDEIEFDLSVAEDSILDEEPVKLVDEVHPGEKRQAEPPAWLVDENSELKRQIESLRQELSSSRMQGDDAGRKSRPPAAREQEEISRLRGELHKKEVILREEMDKRTSLDQKVADLISEVGCKEDEIQEVREKSDLLRKEVEKRESDLRGQMRVVEAKLAEAQRLRDLHVNELEDKIKDLQMTVNRLLPFEMEFDRLKEQETSRDDELLSLQKELEKKDRDLASDAILRDNAIKKLQAVLKMLRERLIDVKD